MKRNSAFAATIILFLTACGALGLQPAKTLEERLAYAYASHTAALQATSSSLNNQAITAADAREMLGHLDEARRALDATRAAVMAGDMGTAEGKLAVALQLLTTVQTYLHSQARRT